MNQQLTICELKVFELMKKPLVRKEIAEKLHVSLADVRFHMTNIYRKLGMRDRLEFLCNYGEIRVP